MNKVWVNEEDEIGEIILIGPQTQAMVEQAIAKTIAFDAEQSRLYGRIVTLIDVTDVGSVEPSALKVTLHGLSAVNYDRIAFLNAAKPLQVALEAMIIVTGRGDKIQFFHDRAKAVQWLQ